MILKRGDKGSNVEQLQLKLKAAGYDPGDVDGDYGPKTEAAVLAFQLDRPDVDDDGKAGPQTMGALNAAVLRVPAAESHQVAPNTLVQCDDATWALVQQLIADIIKNVKYGPGRGLWVNGKFVITYGAGRLGGTTKMWPNVLGKTYPSFHCTSWCNFFMSWLCRRNQDFTHAGNVPAIWDLLLKSPDIHVADDGEKYRGFGDVCYQITPDGSAVKRHGVSKVMDIVELYNRRASMPSFVVFGQSTLRYGKWNWWHHTGFFMFRDGKMFRIAADGYKDAQKRYSAKAMEWVEITPANLGNYSNCVYRCYGVRTADGTYGDKSRPYATVTFE